MRLIFLIFSITMSGCAFDSFGREGEEVVYKHDISGAELCKFEASLSSAGRLSFQQIRFSVGGSKIENSDFSDSIVAEVFVQNSSKSDTVQLSYSDFITEQFDAIELQPGQRRKVHRGLLRRASGKNYFDIRVSRLPTDSLPLNFNVRFSDKMPSGTVITAKVFWADGP